MIKVDLKPIYDSHQSFYGKAQVEIFFNWVTLYSYNTKICEIDIRDGKIHKFPHYSSKTTTRHIKEFCKQFKIDYNDYCKA